MFEYFTHKAIKAIQLAQEETKRMKRNYLGVEHLLLGLSLAEDGFAATALNSMGATSEALREEIDRSCGFGEEIIEDELPVFTPGCKRVLELSWNEARELHHNYIGTEHLLLGITTEGESKAIKVLDSLEVDIPGLAKAVHDLVDERSKNKEN